MVHAKVITTRSSDVVGLRRVANTEEVGQLNTLLGQPLLVGVLCCIGEVLVAKMSTIDYIVVRSDLRRSPARSGRSG